MVIVVYSICGIQYYRRYSKNSPIISRSNKESNDFDTTLRGTFTKKLKHMTYALIFMTTCLFIRYVWTLPLSLSLRVITMWLKKKLTQCDLPYNRTSGWLERTYYQHSNLFQYVFFFFYLSVNAHISNLCLKPDVLDATMVTLAIYTFNVAHPGRLFFAPSDDDS